MAARGERAGAGKRPPHRVMASLAADDRVAKLRNCGRFARLAGGLAGRRTQFRSIIDGLGLVRLHANTRQNWSHFRPMLWSPESPGRIPHYRSPEPSPMVFIHAPDPVGSGLVTSLSHPGGNATGFSLFEFGIAENGWSFSNRLLRPRRARRWHAMRPLPPGSASGRRSSRSRRFWACR